MFAKIKIQGLQRNFKEERRDSRTSIDAVFWIVKLQTMTQKIQMKKMPKTKKRVSEWMLNRLIGFRSYDFVG